MRFTFVDGTAAVVLQRQLKKNIGQLEIRAKAENKKLTQKKSPKGLPVVEAFNVEIEPAVSEVLALDIPFLKSFSGRQPRTIEEFVRFAGGLSASINKLIDFRAREPNRPQKWLLQDHDDEVIEYVDVIENMLVIAKGKTPQRISSDKVPQTYPVLPLPFCALCYRRPNQSLYFCQEHHSSRNASAYKKATRRLASAVYRHSNNESEKRYLDEYKQGGRELTATVLYRWLALFSVHPRMAIGRLNLVDKAEADWTDYADVILAFTKSNYPRAYEMIMDLESRGESFDAWIVEIARSLGGAIEANLWQLKDADIWLETSDNMQKSMTLLNCISRYEAFRVVASFPVLVGVIKGTNVDVEKRVRLKAMLEQRETNPDLTMGEIAKRLGVSRTAVYKLKNKLK